MSSAADDYQHIEFGVDEVMESKAIGLNDPLYKVSSTLNPQAPEFILGCQAAQKVQHTAPPEADVPDGAHFNLLNGPDAEASALDNHQVCQDLDGLPGSLGQRERKKKKKRPPGYYSYLDPSTGITTTNSNSSAADVTSATALVNGHALSGPHHSAEDVDGKTFSGGEHCTSASVSTASSAAAVASPEYPPSSTANQRTCDSPDDSSLELTSGATSLSDGNNATSSSLSSSQSRGVTEEPRTADEQLNHVASQSPELSDTMHSPCSKSPLPSSATPSAATSNTTTELEGIKVADGGVANGLAEPDTPIGGDGHKEDWESGEQADVSPDSCAPPVVSEQATSPAVPAAPTANLPKSWASLFHNSKPLPGGPQAFVEVKNVVEPVSPSVTLPEQPEKPGEVKEGPVHVSEDHMAHKLAGIA